MPCKGNRWKGKSCCELTVSTAVSSMARLALARVRSYATTVLADFAVRLAHAGTRILDVDIASFARPDGVSFAALRYFSLSGLCLDEWRTKLKMSRRIVKVVNLSLSSSCTMRHMQLARFSNHFQIHSPNWPNPRGRSSGSIVPP